MRVSLKTYQEVDAIMSDPTLSDIDKTLFCACSVYNKTPDQLDKETAPKKVLRMIGKLETVFKKTFKLSCKKYIGVYKINYDIDKLTFGQFIELCFFFQYNMVDKAHFILATMGKTVVEVSHPIKAQYFLNRSISSTLGAVTQIRDNFYQFNARRSDLFGLDPEVYDDSSNNSVRKKFQENYGWFYAAEMVAAYERISIKETYNLSVTRALNDLGYLKAKQKFEKATK